MLVNTWEQPHASTLLSALHNLITKSIQRKWFSAGRGKTFCYAKVRAGLAEAWPNVTTPPTPAGLPEDVVGMGPKATPACAAAA